MVGSHSQMNLIFFRSSEIYLQMMYGRLMGHRESEGELERILKI